MGVWHLIEGHPVIATGVATFFFGFGAGALLNLYLKAIGSPLVTELRASLTYVSSIVGDGLLLPAVNMLVVWSLLQHRELVDTATLLVALGFGIAVTLYFHIVQAVRGLVNWAMPRPWRWNGLGAFHAAYMLAVTTLISLFYVVAIAGLFRAGGPGAWEVAAVTAGIGAFFVLLRLDYQHVEWGALVPSTIARRLR